LQTTPYISNSEVTSIKASGSSSGALTWKRARQRTGSCSRSERSRCSRPGTTKTSGVSVDRGNFHVRNEHIGEFSAIDQETGVLPLGTKKQEHAGDRQKTPANQKVLCATKRAERNTPKYGTGSNQEKPGVARAKSVAGSRGIQGRREKRGSAGAGAAVP
jgi:hypothetical protein